MVYKFRPGFSSKVSAPVAGERLEEIREANDGLLRPRDVVESARPKDDPLHPHFEWNNKLAADLYREDQARTLIRSVEIVRESDDMAAEPKREIAYVSVAKPFQTGQGYVATSEAMADPEQREFVLTMAVAQFRALRRRYGHLEELSHVWAAVDELEAVPA